MAETYTQADLDRAAQEASAGRAGTMADTNPSGFTPALQAICRERCACFGDPPCWRLPDLVEPCEHITPCPECWTDLLTAAEAERDRLAGYCETLAFALHEVQSGRPLSAAMHLCVAEMVQTEERAKGMERAGTILLDHPHWTRWHVLEVIRAEAAAIRARGET